MEGKKEEGERREEEGASTQGILQETALALCPLRARGSEDAPPSWKPSTPLSPSGHHYTIHFVDTAPETGKMYLRLQGT